MSTTRRSIFGSIRDKMSSKKSEPAPSISSQLPRRQSSLNPFSNPNQPTKMDSPADQPPPYTLNASSPAAAAPPRAISPAPSRMSNMSNISILSVSTADDPYAFLSQFDTIFLIDDSASMRGSRWRETREALCKIAPICTAHDKDGIDIYFLNSTNRDQTNVTSAQRVEELFDRITPHNGTPTGLRIERIFRRYMAQYKQAIQQAAGDATGTDVKPVNMIVITDGCANDDPGEYIRLLARELDDLDAPSYQVGIQFFQVGRDEEARRALAELDDELTDEANPNLRDIVDTVAWDGVKATANNALSADGILKVVLGAVVKKLDRRVLSSGRSSHLRV